MNLIASLLACIEISNESDVDVIVCEFSNAENIWIFYYLGLFDSDRQYVINYVIYELWNNI